ncbi:MAG: M20/M25/M40 family metallo-hydrolase [Planctomycetota bacterium]|nr:M20/M25/M40 family metallo-hydrolase [Planctomycetota bacterium]
MPTSRSASLVDVVDPLSRIRLALVDLNQNRANQMKIDQVIDQITGSWIAEETLQLVRVPSVTLHEQRVCQLYEQQLRALGLEVQVREVTPGRNNLYARLSGTGDGPTLMLNGHLDTIPNQNQQPVYQEGDLLYGRGTTDMKGGMAAILAAVRGLQLADVRLQGDLLLTAVVGHEEPEAKKDGPLAMIEDLNEGHISCDRILIVEGPDALWIMSMGSMVFTIALESERGGTHTQYVPFGDNPLRYLGEALTRFDTFQQELDQGLVHPLAGPERIDLGIVQAGDYFNRIPQTCKLTGTRRWAPGRQAETVLEELRALIDPIARSGGLRANVSMEHQREPFETPGDDPLVEAVATAHRQVTTTEAEVVGKRIVGDANLYVHGSGVPTIYYGPSNETAHADIENVSIQRLQSAARVYALAAMEYCGVQ